MSKPILSNHDFGSVAKVINLPAPTAAGDAATKAYVDAAVEGLKDKGTCKVATSSNVSIASPGATLDGIAMVLNDPVLVMTNTTASENGKYIWNGAAVPMTRSADMNASAEFNQAIVSINQGTSAGNTFRQTTVDPIVGTTAIAFAAFGATTAATTVTSGISRFGTQAEVDAGALANVGLAPSTLAAWASRPKRFAASFGDGSATQYTLAHNLNTLDFTFRVYRVSDNVTVDCDATASGVNGIQLNFAIAPTSNQYRCVVTA